MSGRLEGKIAIITGGTSGIGRGTVDLFLKEGAKVVVGDVQDHKGEAMARELGASFSYCRTNVAEEADIKSLVDHCLSKFGRLDVMFNNAGLVGATGDIDELDMTAFDDTIAVLLRAVFLGYKYAVPPMKEQKSGSIISTSSVAGLQAGMAPHTYSVCKAGVRHLARVASSFITGQDITVDGGLTAGPPSNLAELLDLENAVAEFMAENKA